MYTAQMQTPRKQKQFSTAHTSLDDKNVAFRSSGIFPERSQHSYTTIREQTISISLTDSGRKEKDWRKQSALPLLRFYRHTKGAFISEPFFWSRVTCCLYRFHPNVSRSGASAVQVCVQVVSIEMIMY